jgi:hypothetical protein
MRVLSLFLALLPAAVWAQPRPFDCQASAPHRQFDFWVGQWEVRDVEGVLQGHNLIEVVQKGCALREQWTSVQGGTGESLNYYTPESGYWHQLWIDAGASTIDISGKLENGSMVLRGSIYYLQRQQSFPFRGSWTPLEDGRVRQFFQQQDEDGEWQTWFEGFYSRQ